MALVQPDNWTTHGYANSRTSHLADWRTRGLVKSPSSQPADWSVNSQMPPPTVVVRCNVSVWVCMYVCILRARVQPTLDPYTEAFL